MALADTTRAIGAVSLALKKRIDKISNIATFIGRPSETRNTNPHLNLFLYEISFDPHLKNRQLNEGEKPPLWVVLKYLLTAFESDTDSDSETAHLHLGAALRAVYTDDLLKIEGLDLAIIEALSPNPSPLHVTFDESPSDLIAKLMQGPDDKVRLSACFQVRPVMIAAAEPGDFSLLVGVDYTKPPVTLADPYVRLDVIPSMGAHIDEISPVGFEAGEEVALKGKDLHLSGLSVMLGPVELPVTMQRPDELRFKVDKAIIGASSISAGSHPVTVVLTLPGTGKKRKSNTVIGNLVPTLNTVVVGTAIIDDIGPPLKSHRDIDLTGTLLGLDSDDTLLAFYCDGKVQKMFDVLIDSAGPPAQQTGQRLVMVPANAVPEGEYNMILIVNGQQAPQSPKVIMA